MVTCSSEVGFRGALDATEHPSSRRPPAGDDRLPRVAYGRSRTGSGWTRRSPAASRRHRGIRGR
ncbi:hypothetical protein FTX61_18730 [Nitriliruptoraceae bacterium ZYF776]|nr:hypothetical protein [Profundirhabdus halotolerans]